MSVWVFLASNILTFIIVIALLRQMNVERQERKDMMEKYRELALRVRVTQLQWEGASNIQPPQSPSWQDFQNDEAMFSGSTVTDLEGDDKYKEFPNG